ncbi:dimethyladenosine transferase family protein [Tritrichomonas foetus]|uniref:rRNA adenine N(6)-methyltransferase n=1 Tax=Tritrichomonas foetus TaxID=1144522 RepID=A0A1J4J9D3_9EUKA|nr:dimethyladenosine transferase family protein [Tritrichomonas foetus]|eukprot:OHS93836.1 dimethyladenosine transferase family protein [Tritrichomonas foetus]
MSQAKRTTKKAGLFQMNHSLGQNMLKSKLVVKNIVDNGEPRPGDVILEIGPGVGNMTQDMISRGCNVIAVEKDPRMVVELNKRFHNNPQIMIKHADILTVDLPQFDLCISNIPYNISSAIVFKLLMNLNNCKFRRAVLMVQKEFADRIVARPGTENWGRLAINTQLFANVRQVMSVSRKNFVPAPKVDSAVITIQPRENIPDIDFAEWDGLIKLCFARPNRTLQATFKKKKTLAMLEKNRADFMALHPEIQVPNITIHDFMQGILANAMIQEQRPIHLDIEDFLGILNQCNEGGLHFK